MSSTPLYPDPAKLASCLTLIVNKNEAGLTDLYDLTLNWVYGLANRIVGKQEDTEEVVVDVYYYIWEHAASYQEEKGKIISWMLTITRSRAIDCLRRKRSTEESKADLVETIPANSNTNPDYLMLNLQKNTIIFKSMNQLSISQKQIVALAFFQGLSHQEVANHLKLPLGTVKSHLRRGLKVLSASSSLQDLSTSEGEGFHE